MTRRILIAALLLLLMPLAANAGFFWQADGAFLEAQFDSKQGAPTQRVFFVWEPHNLSSTDVVYEVFVLCTRYDAGGEEVGKNKFKVKSIAIGPTDAEVIVKAMAGKINEGFQSREVPELAKFAGGRAVVGEATFHFKKKFNAGDILLCRIDITETV